MFCFCDQSVLQPDNGLVLRNIEKAPSLYKNLRQIVKTYAKKVANDVVAPLLEAQIVQTILHQKQIMAREGERLCFMQQEITRLQHWMISVYPSTTDPWVH